MQVSPFPERVASLPKAELHVHLEGSIRPAIASALAARHGVKLTEEEVRRRYAYTDFAGFLDAFKWVTSFVRGPGDFALIAEDLAEQLIEQKVVYAEVTLSVGVMFLRQQQPEANFAAIVAATEPFEKRGLRLNWIFDAVRQFGAEAAMRVVQAARRCASRRIVAFGIGGDELSLPAGEFRGVYERAEEYGFHRLIHAGEIGGPEKIREAIEILGVERIGHGIAAIRDVALMEELAERRIPLEICPESNLRTGALGVQLGKSAAAMEEHPLAEIVRRGVAVTLATDDPAMFHTSLEEEYRNAWGTGLTEEELADVVENGFRFAFGEVGRSL
ncbi:MAG TPA: adenosine deaminase [Candidatus Baltobacteraceae bacterium]|nr:adenosine deaminase [Candidatus Baltobacteraceae bacterium]